MQESNPFSFSFSFPKELGIEAFKITINFVTLHFNLIDHLSLPMRNQLGVILI